MDGAHDDRRRPGRRRIGSARRWGTGPRRFDPARLRAQPSARNRHRRAVRGARQRLPRHGPPDTCRGAGRDHRGRAGGSWRRPHRRAGGIPTRGSPRARSNAADDPPLALADLDRLDGVITGCAVAIAETGTIVLDAGPGQGRRALSLLPDLHVCVVMADQVVGSVPEALERLDRPGRRPGSADPRRPATSSCSGSRVSTARASSRSSSSRASCAPPANGPTSAVRPPATEG